MAKPDTSTGTPTLSRRLKLLYSTGDLTTSIPMTIVMFFRFVFLTDIAGLGPATAGWVVLAGRLWDAVNDPLIGQWADRIRSPLGRRRVLLIAGALPLGVFYAMMWVVPGFGEGSKLALAIYFAITFIAFDTTYTIVHIGYNALTPQLTQDYDERSNLNGYRMAYGIGGTLGALIFKTVLGWYIADEYTVYRILGFGLAASCVLPPLLVFYVTRKLADGASEAILLKDEEPLPTREALRATLINRPFWIVMGLYLFSWTTASLMASMLVFYIRYYMQTPAHADFVVLAAQFSAIVCIPLTVYLSKRLDKRRAFITGCVCWIAILLGISGLGPDQLGLAYVLAALSGFGIATAYVLPWSMIPDLIEVDQRKTGQRREASYYSFVAFFQKLGTAAALWAVGQGLDWSGYIVPLDDAIRAGTQSFSEAILAGMPAGTPAYAAVSELTQALGAFPAQPDTTLDMLRILMGPVPAALLMAAIACAWFFPIDRESHEELLRELDATA